MRHNRKSSRIFSLIFPAMLVLALASSLQAQKKIPPFKLPIPPAKPSGPAPAWEQALKQKAAEQAVSTLLNNQLPLKLDANAIYPTVLQPPGGPFSPRPLPLTAANLDRPLPPGDYAIPMLAFCTEYSVHRPGHGIAYRLGPMQGKAAGAIGTLIWRGSEEKNLPPQQIQAVSWAIQSGITYNQMPKSYQDVIDQVIPEYRSQISGDFVQGLEDTYAAYSKQAQLPPLEQMLGKMGKPGELALSARKQRAALLRQNTTDQVREQVLFSGQESGVYTPVKSEEGPWTERIPGVAYMRFKIYGGNLAPNNIMEVRILPTVGAVAQRDATPRLIEAAFNPDSTSHLRTVAGCPATPANGPTPGSLIQGSIGCAVGQGAQCLAPVPALNNSPLGQGGSIGNASETQGQVLLTHNGATSPLTPCDPISMGDTISTGPNGRTFIQLADGTQMTLAENTKLVIDNYIYDPNSNKGSATYRFFEGAFQYVGGLLSKNNPGDVHVITETDGVGIRGTEFIAKVTARSTEINLIHGAIDVTPKNTKKTVLFSGPVTITADSATVRTAALTQTQYDQIKARSFPNAIADASPILGGQ